MAQGNLKKRSDKFLGKSKGKGKAAKPLGPRKGRVIAPKKAARVKAEKQKKTLQKNIGRSIEQEIRQRAVKDGNELRILHDPQGSSSKPKGSSKQKKADQ